MFENILKTITIKKCIFTCLRAILCATLISCLVLRAIGLPGTIPKALKFGFPMLKFFCGLIKSGFSLNVRYTIGD